ncbi:MAG: molybdopterin-dependent oxidoreductase [Eubacteriales bacterium]
MKERIKRLKKDKEQEQLKEENKQSDNVSRRDFLVGAGTVVVGGAISAGLLSSCDGGETTTITTTKTVEKTSTVTVGDGDVITSTVTETEAGGEAVTVTKTVTSGTSSEPAFEEEQSFVQPVSPNCRDACVLDVKNGKVIRLRPLHYNWKYTEEELADRYWSFEARGKTFTVPNKACTGYLQLCHKTRLYSPSRVKYPLQRIDWEPGGVNVNAQNRGKSKYKRISWDEATEMIASEVVRIQEKYGQASVFCGEGAPHTEEKNVHINGANNSHLMYLSGDWTFMWRNADSWEGWYWGTMHVSGTGSQGAPIPQDNIMIDICQNGEMIVQFGDSLTTGQGYGRTPVWPTYRWYKDAGVKQVWVTPELNYAAAAYADKWIPVICGRDDALDLAIIYVWLTEDTWNKDYVSTHAVGMEYIEDYVMGRSEDMVEKTPEWAAPRCGVPAHTIKALARQWAAKKTSSLFGTGSAICRVPYSTEPCRLRTIMVSMQGMGGPGVHCTNQSGGFQPSRDPNPNVDNGQVTLLGQADMLPITKYHIVKPLVPNAVLDGYTKENPMSWWGHGGFLPVEDQFNKYTYPAEDGGAELHMMWYQKNCFSVCWNHGYKWHDMYRDSKIECIVFQSITFENDNQFGDIILPINTNMEEEDITFNKGRTPALCYHEGPAAQPIGESKSDMEACALIAEKLEAYGGRFEGLVEKYTQGRTVNEWCRHAFDNSNVTDLISWEEMKEKQYWIPPVKEGWESKGPGMRLFYDDPENNPLGTPTGKLEFYSERLADNFPDDKHRAPFPHYVIGGPGEEWYHDESLVIEDGAERCKTYPLVCQSNHPRWRVHVQGDDYPWTREIPTCKVKGYDGYMYEPVWMSPELAEEKGIRNGDIVKVFNDRGITLCGAYVTERMHFKEHVYVDHGAQLDLISDRVNRGGDVNVISPEKIMGPNASAMVCNAFLVDIEKLDPVEMEQWRVEYPESFAKEYDPAHGLIFSNWIEDGGEE